MDAIELIRAERERQQSVEGWTEKHDDEHDYQELAMAAAVYALPDPERKRPRIATTGNPSLALYLWPWSDTDLKTTPSDRVRELVKAGALIVAEIERLQRKETNR